MKKIEIYDNDCKPTLYVEYIECRRAYRIYNDNDYYSTVGYIDSLDELTGHREYNYYVVL